MTANSISCQYLLFCFLENLFVDRKVKFPSREIWSNIKQYTFTNLFSCKTKAKVFSGTH